MIGKLPESAGSNLGPQLDKFEADFGFHGAPWCGIFAGHVLEAAGLKPPHTVAAVASILDLARNGDPPFVKGILPVSEARPGDLVTFGGTEHVALVTKVDAAGVHTIAGNTSQSNVSETTYSPGSVTGVVRPDYVSGRPGSIPGVWDYAGVQPPGAGGVPAAAPVAEAPAAASVAEAPAAASQQPAVAGAEVPPQPAAVAGTVPPEQPVASTAPAAQQPPAAAFNPRVSHAPGRNTVQFLPAVKPTPGSPLFAPTPRPARSPRARSDSRALWRSAEPGSIARGTAAAGFRRACSTRPPGRRRRPGGSISVSSSLLTPGQAKFAGRLAELTGLDPHVVAAWELAEESGSAAQGARGGVEFQLAEHRLLRQRRREDRLRQDVRRSDQRGGADRQVPQGRVGRSELEHPRDLELGRPQPRRADGRNRQQRLGQQPLRRRREPARHLQRVGRHPH